MMQDTWSKRTKKMTDHTGREFASVSECLDFWHVSKRSYYHKRKKGIPLEQILTSTRKVFKDHLGKEYNSIREMCNAWKIPYRTYITRKHDGWTLERALTQPHKSEILMAQDWIKQHRKDK